MFPIFQVLLQVLIILSGNYNFFNLLTLTLCLSLLDDQHVHFWLGRRSVRSDGGTGAAVNLLTFPRPPPACCAVSADAALVPACLQAPPPCPGSVTCWSWRCGRS